MSAKLNPSTIFCGNKNMAKRSQEFNSLVIACGCATSALALVLIYLLDQAGTNIMGWYGDKIIPVGALLMGVASGCGYVIGSYWSNTRVSRFSMLFIFIFGLVTFCISHYINYRFFLADNNIPAEQLSFIKHVQIECETMQWERDKAPFGGWGYLYRVLEAIGFSLGGIVPLGILMGIPYCDQCNRYMRRRVTAYMISDELFATFKKKKKKEKEELLQSTVNKMVEVARPVMDVISKNDFDQNLAMLNALPKKTSKGRLANISFQLRKCPLCDNHTVRVMYNTFNVAKRPVYETMGQIQGFVPPEVAADETFGQASGQRPPVS
jgi:hypothetical protein